PPDRKWRASDSPFRLRGGGGHPRHAEDREGSSPIGRTSHPRVRPHPASKAVQAGPDSAPLDGLIKSPPQRTHSGVDACWLYDGKFMRRRRSWKRGSERRGSRVGSTFRKVT